MAIYQEFLSKITIKQWLRSPVSIPISIGISIYLGIYQPQIAHFLAPAGTLYLGLLKMCVLPILISVITLSIQRLIASQRKSKIIKRIMLIFLTGLLSVSTLAAVAGIIARSGDNLSVSTLNKLGVVVNQSGIDLEISLNQTSAEPKESFIDNIDNFVNTLVPDNVFSALSQGQTLKILFFSIVFGVLLGIIQESLTRSLLEALESIYKAFNFLIQELIVYLPLGLCFLLSVQLSELGFDIIFAMVRFIGTTLVVFFIVYFISTILIWQRTNKSLFVVIDGLKNLTFLSLATSSSIACIPFAIVTLIEKFNLDHQMVQLVTPLAITLCRFGSVIYFALAALFVAQLYHRDVSFGVFVAIILLSILAGMATSGATGIVTLSMLDIVLHPLQLPVSAVLVLFIAIDPLIDPFRTLGITHTGMAATALIVPLQAKVFQNTQ